MKDHLSSVLFKTREGLIFLAASFIYFLIGLLAKCSPAIASAFGFIGVMAVFMPTALLIMLFKMRVYRKDFQSSWFSTGTIVFVALIPVITVTKSALFH